MKRVKTIALLLAVGMLLSLAACGVPKTAPAETPAAPAPTETPAPAPAATPDPNAVTVTDLAGRQVSLVPGSCRRVACVGPGALRMYSYIGDENLLCGVEDVDNPSVNGPYNTYPRAYVLVYGDVFAQKPSCGAGGPDAQGPELDKLQACKPDVVVTTFAQAADAMQQTLGVPVIVLENGPMGVFDQAFKDSMTLLGTVFANEAKALDLNGFIDYEVGQIRRRLSTLEDEYRITAYIGGLGEPGVDAFSTAQNYYPFEIAKIQNAVSGLPEDGVQTITREQFDALGGAVDLLILDAGAVNAIRAEKQSDPGLLDGCAAWRSGSVCLQMMGDVYGPNYEMQLLNAWYVAKSAYPARFEDVPMLLKADEVTNYFYDEKLSETLFQYPGCYGGYQKVNTYSFFG